MIPNGIQLYKYLLHCFEHLPEQFVLTQLSKLKITKTLHKVPEAFLQTQKLSFFFFFNLLGLAISFSFKHKCLSAVTIKNS